MQRPRALDNSWCSKNKKPSSRRRVNGPIHGTWRLNECRMITQEAFASYFTSAPPSTRKAFCLLFPSVGYLTFTAQRDLQSLTVRWAFSYLSAKRSKLSLCPTWIWVLRRAHMTMTLWQSNKSEPIMPKIVARPADTLTADREFQWNRRHRV